MGAVVVSRGLGVCVCVGGGGGRDLGGTFIYLLRIAYVFWPLKSLKLLNLIIPLNINRDFRRNK